MRKLTLALVASAAFIAPALAGSAAPIGQLYPTYNRTVAPVGTVLPGIVQSYTPSTSPLNVLQPSNTDDGESYGQALQEPQPGAPNGWTCSSGC